MPSIISIRFQYVFVKSLITVMVLAGIGFGFYISADGLIEGPNYFTKRLITIERMHYEEHLIENKWGERSIIRDWIMDYSYLDLQKQKQYETRKLFDNELPKKPGYYRSGDILIHRIPVPESDGGSFGLNLDAYNGLAVAIYFFIIGGPIIILLHFGHLPIVRKLKTTIALIPVLICSGIILFQIFRAFL